jgi:hypothetical protein
VLSCVVDLQELNTLFLTRFRTCKIATPPPKKKTLVKTTLRDWCLHSPSSMTGTVRCPAQCSSSKSGGIRIRAELFDIKICLFFQVYTLNSEG